jgi:hypothetical protein
MATGYVAPRPDTWETPEMKAYVADFPPALVARDQLEFAVAELSTYQNQRVTRIFNDALHAAITGQKAADALLRKPGPGRRASWRTTAKADSGERRSSPLSGLPVHFFAEPCRFSRDVTRDGRRLTCRVCPAALPRSAIHWRPPQAVKRQ